MNKKIFTLLATSLMLLLTAIVMNAQVPGFYGEDVKFLPDRMGKGAYLLKVTSFGNHLQEPSSGWLLNYGVMLALDAKGYLKLVSAGDIVEYKELREALWCINVVKPEKLGQQPAYNFLNKAYQTMLAVDTGRWLGNAINTDITSGVAFNSQHTPTAPDFCNVQTYWSNLESVFATGQFGDWAFSHSYNTIPLEKDQPLKIEIPDEPDYFMTFAFDLDAATGSYQPRLVKVHARDFETGSPFYINRMLRFTIVKAAPRVLTADDFNSTLWTNPDGDFSKLSFDPNTTPASNINVFDQNLTAHDAIGNSNTALYRADHYLNFRKPVKGGTWVYLAADDDLSNYYNGNNMLFPILKDNGKATTDDKPSTAWGPEYDFRLVYYPSEDSVVMNVRGFTHIDDQYGNILPHAGEALDMESYPSSDGLFNDEIWNYLIVRMQDLAGTGGPRVITVHREPTNARFYFGINDCKLSDDRIAVPRNLYVIRDILGRYLVMPLEVGDFTPRWEYLRNNENPMKTPSSQWLVYPLNENSTNSSIVLINREFEWVRIEGAQIYTKPHLFYGTWNWLWSSPLTDYGAINGIAELYYSVAETSKSEWNQEEGWHGSFIAVQDDKGVAAKLKAAAPKPKLTQEEMEKQYRTSPYLGYKFIDTDTLNYFTYSFNYLHAFSNNYYLGPKPNQTGDTILYAIPERNNFELEIPYFIDDEGPEPYGIGWDFDLGLYKSTEDIAPLVRYFYTFTENDYWNFLFSDNAVVLAENGRYAFTDEVGANVRGIEKPAFYLRFTYQPPGKPEYFTILERIEESTAEIYAAELGLEIMLNLKVRDRSHGGSYGSTLNDSLGIAVLSIDDHTLFARMQPKVTGSVVSTFAVSNAIDPLYRRFNEGVYDRYGISGSKAEDGGVAGNDDPRTVKIYRSNNEPFVDYLYEDRNSVNAYGKGINFLSLENIFDHNAKMADPAKYHDPHGDFAFYLDTAYVNRGTGWIKPQYLIVVGPKHGTKTGCLICGDLIALRPWVYGRFLINATDSARFTDAYGSFNPSRERDKDYIWETHWERLAFVPGIHLGDSLYILNGVDYNEFFSIDQLEESYLNEKLLKAAVNNGRVHVIDLGNNYHKDVVFSMRFIEKGNYQDFMLESETTKRDILTGRMIAPMEGGWVKWENHEMVISRGSYEDIIRQAEIWNTEWTNDEPVANDKIGATAVKVIAGEGNVAILNAAGKRVTISNVLGQTVASAVLTSDNATVSAPKGILVVAVEGESAVKAVVK